MFKINLPGRNELTVRHIVFDFNGTLATDGKLDPVVREMLARLKALADIYILTSDTYGSVRSECQDLGVQIITLSGNHCGEEKRKFVHQLGADNTICVGNGTNDSGMFEACSLAIIILGDEGCSVEALFKANIAVKNIRDALMMLLNTRRITATLRG